MPFECNSHHYSMGGGYNPYADLNNPYGGLGNPYGGGGMGAAGQDPFADELSEHMSRMFAGMPQVRRGPPRGGRDEAKE